MIMTKFFDENDQLTVGWFYKTFLIKVKGQKAGVWIAKKASGVLKERSLFTGNTASG